MRIVMLLTMCAFSCAAAVQGPAHAQDPAAAKAPGTPPQPEPQKGENGDLQELVNDIMAARLARELSLNDEETVLLLRHIADYRAQANALQKERREVLKSLKATLKSGAPEPEIEADLSKLQNLDAKVQELKRNTFAKVGEGMNVTQRARLYVFYNEFENEMRRLVQQARERVALRRGWQAEGSATGPSQGGPRIRPSLGDERLGHPGLARPLSRTRGPNRQDTSPTRDKPGPNAPQIP